MKNRLALFFLVASTTFAPLLKAELRDSFEKNPEKQNMPESEKQNKNTESTKIVDHLSTEIHEKQNISKFETQTNIEQEIQNKPAFSGIRPEDVVWAESTNVSEGSQDLTTQDQFENMEEQEETEKLSTLFGISFDKKQLMYYDAGAVAIVIICGVTYVLYKNGTLKKISNYIGDYIVEHKFEVKAAVGTACILALVGIYAKQQGMTLQNSGNWITSFWN